MVKICFISIFLCSCALALIASITKGFEQATYQKMQTIYPQLIIDGYGQELAYDKIASILKNPQYKIQHFSPQQSQQVLLDNHEDQITNVIQIKSIEPALEKKVTALEAMILPKYQQHSLEALIQNNNVIIGKKIALNNNISHGSMITILYSPPRETSSRKIKFYEKKAIVSGIFETGIDDFDANLIYCAPSFFKRLFPDEGITQIYLKAKPQHKEQAIIQSLEQRLRLSVYSWKDMYKSIISALELEKYGMLIVLLLIMIIASTNIISLLFIQITQKKKDIALLFTLGLTTKKIQQMFITLSIFIAGLASAAGLGAAFLIGKFLQHYKWIRLPDNVYYTTHLPVILDPLLFLYIFFGVILISFIASTIPVYNIKKMNISTILKNES